MQGCVILSVIFVLCCLPFVLEILDHVASNELDNPHLIDIKAKERIARSAGKSLDEVGRLMAMFNQSRVLHAWLQLKYDRIITVANFSPCTLC